MMLIMGITQWRGPTVFSLQRAHDFDMVEREEILILHAVYQSHNDSSKCAVKKTFFD